MIFCIDFDGTMVTHEFPAIGREIGAAHVIRALIENGHQVILWTMRDKEYLDEAVNWCKEHGIELYGVNANPDQDWTTSPKAYAHMYIDDAALGVPTHNGHVDWFAIAYALELKHLITEDQCEDIMTDPEFMEQIA